jgi:hypothetical protein
MNLIKIFKEDLKTKKEEIKKNLYDLHFYGGIIVTSILIILFLIFSNIPIIQLYLISISLNFLIWFGKEIAWFTAYTFENRCPWLTKIRKYKFFKWGKPDWKDLRFSFYGSIPFVVLLKMFKNK